MRNSLCVCVCVCSYAEMKLPTTGLLSSSAKHILLLVSRDVCDVVFHCIALTNTFFFHIWTFNMQKCSHNPSECTWVTIYSIISKHLTAKVCIGVLFLNICQAGKCVTLFADRLWRLTAQWNKKMCSSALHKHAEKDQSWWWMIALMFSTCWNFDLQIIIRIIITDNNL